MRVLRLVAALCMAPVLVALSPLAMLYALGRWTWTGAVIPLRRAPLTTATPPTQDEARRWVEQVLAAQRRAVRN